MEWNQIEYEVIKSADWKRENVNADMYFSMNNQPGM